MIQSKTWFVVVAVAASAGCAAPPPDFAGSYTMGGTRTSSSACMGSPPSGAIGQASATISAEDAAGVRTMRMRIGTGNECLLTLQGASNGDATIVSAANCDGTIAPPFLTSASGVLRNVDGHAELDVHWAMAGAGSGPCSVDDVWVPLTR